MKKITVSVFISIVFLLGWLVLTKNSEVVAQRENRDTSSTRDRVAAFCDPAMYPREARGEQLDCPPNPTQASNPTPTTAGGGGGQNPTPTTAGGVGGVPTSTPGPTSGAGGGSTTDDPCAPGKSYTGAYCGWSPGVGGTKSTSEALRIGGPSVVGLSYTAGADLTFSDIMLFAGVLCLLLYAKAKTSTIHRQ